MEYLFKQITINQIMAREMQCFDIQNAQKSHNILQLVNLKFCPTFSNWNEFHKGCEYAIKGSA